MFEDKNEGKKSEGNLEGKPANNGVTSHASNSSLNGDVIVSSSEDQTYLDGSLNLLGSILEADQVIINGNLNLRNSELVIREKRDRLISVEKSSRPKAIDNGLTNNGRFVVTGEEDISSVPDQEFLAGCLTLENATLVIHPEKTKIIGSYKIKHHRVTQDENLMGSVDATIERYRISDLVYSQQRSNLVNNTNNSAGISGFSRVHLESEEGSVVLNIDDQEEYSFGLK